MCDARLLAVDLHANKRYNQKSKVSLCRLGFLVELLARARVSAWAGDSLLCARRVRREYQDSSLQFKQLQWR